MKHNTIRKLAIFLSLAAASNASFAGYTHHACVTPPNMYTMSWRWWSDTAYEVNFLSGPGVHPETYHYAFGRAVTEWLDKTELTAEVGPNEKGKVNLTNGDYGPGFTTAWVHTFSDIGPCTYMSAGNSWDNHQCGTLYAVEKAHTATIVMNDAHLASAGQTTRQLAYLHEIGHVFGLGHANTNCPSFMTSPHDGTEPLTLRQSEIDWFNATYPFFLGWYW